MDSFVEIAPLVCFVAYFLTVVSVRPFVAATCQTVMSGYDE